MSQVGPRTGGAVGTGARHASNFARKARLQTVLSCLSTEHALRIEREATNKRGTWREERGQRKTGAPPRAQRYLPRILLHTHRGQCSGPCSAVRALHECGAQRRTCSGGMLATTDRQCAVGSGRCQRRVHSRPPRPGCETDTGQSARRSPGSSADADRTAR